MSSAFASRCQNLKNLGDLIAFPTLFRPKKILSWTCCVIGHTSIATRSTVELFFCGALDVPGQRNVWFSNSRLKKQVLHLDWTRVCVGVLCCYAANLHCISLQLAATKDSHGAPWLESVLGLPPNNGRFWDEYLGPRWIPDISKYPKCNQNKGVDATWLFAWVVNNFFFDVYFDIFFRYIIMSLNMLCISLKSIYSKSWRNEAPSNVSFGHAPVTISASSAGHT
jgi:hypothetical protein